MFDWGNIIFVELYSHISKFKKEKKSYMTSYLIFSITYFHVFKGLTIGKRVDCKIDPITMWYHAPWRQKAAYYFYEVYNEFVTVFKRLLFGENTTRVSLKETIFLSKRGTLEKMEDNNIIRFFSSHEIPFFLPWYISDKMFIIEVARKYRLWLYFFHEKKKRQFIPLPWKVGEIMLNYEALQKLMITQFILISSI
jgi:hypothetical protein